MLDLLLQNQQKWSNSISAEKIFVRYANRLHLNIEVFKADLQSQEITKRINLDLERARFLNLGWTPTVFLNNKIVAFEEMGRLEEIISKDK